MRRSLWLGAQGVYVWDHRGKKYLDALAGLWCVSLGNLISLLMSTCIDSLVILGAFVFVLGFCISPTHPPKEFHIFTLFVFGKLIRFLFELPVPFAAF
jgi:hypothetical protein